MPQINRCRSILTCASTGIYQEQSDSELLGSIMYGTRSTTSHPAWAIAGDYYADQGSGDRLTVHEMAHS